MHLKISGVDMKRILIKYSCMFLLITLISCSKSEKEIVADINTKICSVISSNPSSESITSAQKILTEEVSKLKTRERVIIRNEVLNNFENCIKSIKFSKLLPQSYPPKLEGNIQKYISLSDRKYSIYLSPNENPAFFINLTFSAKKLFENFNDSIEIKGSIELLNESGRSISSYNIYTTPDLKKILKTGSGDATIKTYLSPVWASFSKEPIKTALQAFELVEKTVSFKVNLSITDNSKNCIRMDKKTEKEYEDILNKLDKKN